MILHHSFGGTYAREQTLAAGGEVAKHVHSYDHLSFLCSGEALVEVDGELEAIRGPRMLEIKAGAAHRITAITDITWLCIHSEALADPGIMKE